jgi:hypothetical protein
LIAISAVWLPAAAYAQVERGDRPELRGGIDSKDDDSSSHDFTIGIDVPYRRASSVTSAGVDSVIDSRPDSHVTPDVYLKWAHQYDWFKASFEVGASLDRYLSVTEANLDDVNTTFKIVKTDGKYEYFAPYFSVVTDKYFLPTFHQPDITYHDFMVGFYSGLGWRDAPRASGERAPIPYSDAENAGDITLYFDARFGRRVSDATDYQNTFAQARMTAAYYFAKDLRLETTGGIRARWYEDYYGDRRTDIRPSASLGLYWSPDWLKKLVKRSELALNIEFYRNFSNLPDKSYTLWEVGPTLSLRTKF